MTAARTGLRQVELVALRRRDVDWMAGVIRVRRDYTRGQWGTPKSRARPGPCRLPTELPRTRPTCQGLPSAGRRRLGVRAPGTRHGPGRLQVAEALRARSRAGRSAPREVRRPAPHPRDTDGRSACSTATSRPRSPPPTSLRTQLPAHGSLRAHSGAAVMRPPPHGPRRRSLTPAQSLRGESLADCSPGWRTWRV